MMEEDFYGTIKLKSGEEIFALICSCDEDDRTLLLLSNPIVVSEVKDRKGSFGYKIEPWLKTTTEDMFIINLSDVLTMSECFDIEMITMHQSYIRSLDKLNRKNKNSKITRKMGYISSVEEAKDILEKIFKDN